MDISVQIPDSIPSEVDILVQENLESLVAELKPIVSEESTASIVKENAVPIVEEPLPQENMAHEIQVTPPITELDIPIIEKPLPQESIAL